MAQKPKKLTKSPSPKSKKKAVPEFSKPFYKKRWFAIFALILVFSSIGGGYMIRKGNAASYTFIRRASENQIRTDSRLGSKKVDGIMYALLGNDAGTVGRYVDTFLTADEARKSSRICAHFKVLKRYTSGLYDNSDVEVSIWQNPGPFGDIGSNSIPSTIVTSTTTSGNVCMKNHKAQDSVIRVGAYSLLGKKGSQYQIGIDTIYGKP